MAQAPQPFQVRLAPDQLWQAINPWFANSSGDQFGLVNITLGQGNEKVERDILAKVGSYGRQIGHLAEALEVVIGLLKDIAPERMASLDQHQKDSLAVALGDVAEVRQIKDKEAHRGRAAIEASRPESGEAQQGQNSSMEACPTASAFTLPVVISPAGKASAVPRQ